MKIAFYGGQTAGLVSLLTILGLGHEITVVYAEDVQIARIAQIFNINQGNKKNLNDLENIRHIAKKADILICCHGRIILKKILLSAIPCFNIHPCLYKYKGAYPIRRLIQEKNSLASVASHIMTEAVDQGKTLIELFTKITHVEHKTEIEVYSELYPLYAEVTKETLTKIIQHPQTYGVSVKRFL